MKTFAKIAVTSIAGMALMGAVQLPAEAAVRYSNPCQGVTHCKWEKTDGEQFTVTTPKRNWKKVLYRYHHLTKAGRSTCNGTLPLTLTDGKKYRFYQIKGIKDSSYCN
ncbi:hypothetical protein IMZ11_00665 [Microtetraspora sp. AC03309]|uniref:hypothetical protein n=1 Tax=Microtetraspora sp. AC03309 TaxID=2779376 RepID=UPI001E46735B|nr:hypothetical protein [Microtetraspora sp. AC03309]MCC5574151.1 hypothetical protein [Microtetraspora sp. AC03309]